MQKNNFIDKFRSKIVLRMTGKNAERFIRKLSSNNIQLLSIKYPKRNIVEITIYKDDYEKVIKLKSIYEINIVDASGLIKIKNVFKVNKVLILCLIVGISLLLLLTNTIFKVEVVHTSSEIRNLLTNVFNGNTNITPEISNTVTEALNEKTYFFNWFFVIQDPFGILSVNIGPFIMPFVMLFTIFLANILIYSAYYGINAIAKAVKAKKLLKKPL